MLNLNGSENGFFNIVYTAVVAVCGALAKEINDQAKGEESFKVFIAEVVLHGFSGWIVGLIATKYLHLTDLTSITIFAGIGGLFGYDLVKILLNMVLKKVVSEVESKEKKEEEN